MASDVGSWVYCKGHWQWSADAPFASRLIVGNHDGVSSGEQARRGSYSCSYNAYSSNNNNRERQGRNNSNREKAAQQHDCEIHSSAPGVNDGSWLGPAPLNGEMPADSLPVRRGPAVCGRKEVWDSCNHVQSTLPSTMHEFRSRRRHAARLRMMEEMKLDLHEFVRGLLHHTVEEYGLHERLLVIGEEIAMREKLSRDAGQHFSHAHQAYRWAHSEGHALEAAKYRQVSRQRNLAVHGNSDASSRSTLAAEVTFDPWQILSGMAQQSPPVCGGILIPNCTGSIEQHLDVPSLGQSSCSELSCGVAVDSDENSFSGMKGSCCVLPCGVCADSDGSSSSGKDDDSLIGESERFSCGKQEIVDMEVARVRVEQPFSRSGGGVVEYSSCVCLDARAIVEQDCNESTDDAEVTGVADVLGIVGAMGVVTGAFTSKPEIGGKELVVTEKQQHLTELRQQELRLLGLEKKLKLDRLQFAESVQTLADKELQLQELHQCGLLREASLREREVHLWDSGQELGQKKLLFEAALQKMKEGEQHAQEQHQLEKERGKFRMEELERTVKHLTHQQLQREALLQEQRQSRISQEVAVSAQWASISRDLATNAEVVASLLSHDSRDLLRLD